MQNRSNFELFDKAKANSIGLFVKANAKSIYLFAKAYKYCDHCHASNLCAKP